MKLFYKPNVNISTTSPTVKMKTLCLCFIVTTILLSAQECLANNSSKSIQKQFFKSIKKNDIKKAKNILKKGINVNIFDRDGRTPLNIAIKKRNTNIVKLLIDNKANVNLKEKFITQFTPLHTTARIADHKEGLIIAKLLINNGAKVDALSKAKLTPLYYAIGSNNQNGIMFINYLLNNNAKINSDMLFITSHPEIIKLLLNKGANINYYNSEGVTPLHDAVEWNKISKVKILIDNGANIHLETKKAVKFSLEAVYPKGSTPLKIAKFYEHNEIIKILINNGAKY